ncbi:MAG: ArsR family transcriptional regulator [Nitrososphaeraceae archaeon]|nr:ArsR family transcriptional regulator [Nitrososphaeraceae archaeon]
MDKPKIIQLNEYNITQKIIEALTNVCSRAVLFSIVNQPKDATQIAHELKLSVSTVYKTLSNLEELALIYVNNYKISDEGKKIKLYKSKIGQVVITIKDNEPILSLYANPAKKEV